MVDDLATRSDGAHQDPGGAPGEGLLARIGKYEIMKVIGEGGFGRVFLGHDPDTGRRVAVKVPRRALTTREG